MPITGFMVRAATGAGEMGGHARGADEHLTARGFQRIHEFGGTFGGTVGGSHREAERNAQLFQDVSAGGDGGFVGWRSR